MKRMIEYAWWGRRRHAETKEQEEVWCSVKEILDMERRGQRRESAKKRNKRGQTRQSERQKQKVTEVRGCRDASSRNASKYCHHQHSPSDTFTVSLGGRATVVAQILIWCLVRDLILQQGWKANVIFFPLFIKVKQASKKSVFPPWEAWWMDWIHGCSFFFFNSATSFASWWLLPRWPTALRATIVIQLIIQYQEKQNRKIGTGVTIQIRYCCVCVCLCA